MKEQHLPEGNYQMEVLGERICVKVLLTMQGKWPDKREALMAHPISGPPRFPWTVAELIEMGATFKPL